eukprot:180021-Hanusia_phi.AAC.2
MDDDEIRNFIRGPSGTSVQIKYQRDSTNKEVCLTRGNAGYWGLREELEALRMSFASLEVEKKGLKQGMLELQRRYEAEKAHRVEVEEKLQALDLESKSVKRSHREQAEEAAKWREEAAEMRERVSRLSSEIKAEVYEKNAAEERENAMQKKFLEELHERKRMESDYEVLIEGLRSQSSFLKRRVEQEEEQIRALIASSEEAQEGIRGQLRHMERMEQVIARLETNLEETTRSLTRSESKHAVAQDRIRKMDVSDYHSCFFLLVFLPLPPPALLLLASCAFVRPSLSQSSSSDFVYSTSSHPLQAEICRLEAHAARLQDELASHLRAEGELEREKAILRAQLEAEQGRLEATSAMAWKQADRLAQVQEDAMVKMLRVELANKEEAMRGLQEELEETKRKLEMQRISSRTAREQLSCAEEEREVGKSSGSLGCAD